MAAGLVLAACSGDDAAPSSTPAPPVPVATAIASPPTPTTPATTAETDTAPSVAADAGPSFDAGAVVGPGADHGWLLVGTARQRPGAPSRAALLTSADGEQWTPRDPTGPEHSVAAAAVSRADGTGVVGGAVDDVAGPVPTIWSVDDDGLGAARPIDGASGTVVALAADDDGALIALTAGDAGPAVAVEQPDGGWRTTALPVDAAVAGLAVRAGVVVVTGAHGRTAAAWRSTDGGSTFVPGTAAAFDAPDQATAFGPVAVTANGFAAAACAPGPDGTRDGLAFSPDGAGWTEIPVHHPRAVVPVVGGGCAAIAVDEDDGIWLSSAAPQPLVYRVHDLRVDRLGIPVRPAGTLLAGAPLIAAAGGAVVAVTPGEGGVATAAASAATLTTDLELDVSMPATSGAVAGAPRVVGLRPLDDRGDVIGTATYPVVTDEPDGSFRWTTTLSAAVLDGDGRLVERPEAAPRGPDGALGGITVTSTGTVALANVADRDADADGGAVGDVVWSRRDPDGTWSPTRVVVGGPGRQAVSAVVHAAGRAVAVGERVEPDDAGAAQRRPLVVTGRSGRFDVVDVDVGDADGVSFVGACAGSASRPATVTAVGVDRTGAGVVATIDPVAATVEVTAAPLGSVPTGCAPVGDETLLVGPDGIVAVGDVGDARPLDVLRPGERITALATGAAGPAVVGTTADGDGFLLAGDTLARVAVPDLGGPGTHVPTGVVARTDAVVVLGLADGAPATWRVVVP
jgi:hypothetical protein